MEATQYPNVATMQLSLTKAWSDGLKRHYIIHEFGHALGLGHEHQRSKFWQFLNPYVNLEKMKQDPVVGGDHNFKTNWAEGAVSYYSSDLDNPEEYDPQSVMHYGLVQHDFNPLGPVLIMCAGYSYWSVVIYCQHCYVTCYYRICYTV